MPAKVCDRSPCQYMQKAIHSLLAEGGDPDRFDIIVMSRSQVPMRVSLEYCPFCGTRIDPDWMELIRERGSKRGG